MSGRLLLSMTLYFSFIAFVASIVLIVFGDVGILLPGLTAVCNLLIIYFTFIRGTYETCGICNDSDRNLDHFSD